MNLTEHPAYTWWSSFSISLLWWLQPEVTCDPPEWYFWSNSSNHLVRLIHFLTGCIFLREMKGFAQDGFLTGTGPLGCDIIQLKNQSMAGLSLWGTYMDSWVLFVPATSPEWNMLVWNFSSLKSWLMKTLSIYRYLKQTFSCSLKEDIDFS
jgi:hypothetical protein